MRRLYPLTRHMPSSMNPEIGRNAAYCILDRLNNVAVDGPTVVKVSVALTETAPVTETGLVLPNEQDGAGLTTGAILQASVTLPV